jgi:hypothetical protein
MPGKFNTELISSLQRSWFKDVNRRDISQVKAEQSLYLQHECFELQTFQKKCYLVWETQRRVADFFQLFKVFSPLLPTLWVPMAYLA